MKTRILYTKVWKDTFFCELSPAEKLLFVYLLTNENMNILHIYECSDRTVMFDTGITAQQLSIAKKKFTESGKVTFYKDYVYVKNADKYEDYKGDRYDKAKATLIRQIGSEVIENLTSQQPVKEGLETTSQVDIIHKSKIINNKTENNINYLREVPQEDIEVFVKEREVSKRQVEEKGMELLNYCLMHGKKYKDYSALLRNAIYKDFKKRTMQPVARVVEPEISEEERQRNLAKIQDMKKNLFGRANVEH